MFFICLLIGVSHQKRIDFYTICLQCIVVSYFAYECFLLSSYSVMKPARLTLGH